MHLLKNSILVGSFLLSSLAQVAAQSSQGAHIALDIKPYKNQWVYLACYYGGIKALADSAYLNADGKGVIKTSKPFPQGIYIMASPSKSILFARKSLPLRIPERTPANNG